MVALVVVVVVIRIYTCKGGYREKELVQNNDFSSFFLVSLFR